MFEWNVFTPPLTEGGKIYKITEKAEGRIKPRLMYSYPDTDITFWGTGRVSSLSKRSIPKMLYKNNVSLGAHASISLGSF